MDENDQTATEISNQEGNTSKNKDCGNFESDFDENIVSENKDALFERIKTFSISEYEILAEHVVYRNN